MPKPTASEVTNLDDLDNTEHAAEHDDDDDEAIPLGEPFALAIGAALLETNGRIPGCIVSARCDCGSAFKFSALAPGYKACPGCGTQYTHALLIAHADDLEIVDQFYEVIASEPGDDDGELAGDDDEADDDADDQDDDQDADDAADDLPPPA